MCGIFGFFNAKGKPLDERLLDGAIRAMAHRGPDGAGKYLRNHIALGHVRLAITDPHQRSSQPMESLDGRYVIVFNGEIYNFKDLRSDLSKLGEIFQTESDTEVILIGFQRHGKDFVEKLNGIFSFAIWDNRDRSLFICRDRLGVKPLYIFQADSQWIFASEIKSILAVREDIRVDYLKLIPYLSFRYRAGSETPFSQITTIEPGTIWVISLDGKITVRTYWSLSTPAKIAKLDEEDAIGVFYSKFEKAIERQIAPDISQGIALSGGVDSSSILGMMARKIQNVEAFSLRTGVEDNEAFLAQSFAAQHGYETQVAQIEALDFQFYQESLFYLEEPLTDSILVASYKLSEIAKSKVKVIISGEGADEILGGYFHHKLLCLEEKLTRTVWGRSALSFAGLSGRISPDILQQVFPYSGKLGATGVRRFIEQLKKIPDWSKCFEIIAQVFNIQDLGLLLPKQLVAQYSNSRNSTLSSFWPRGKIGLDSITASGPEGEDLLNILTRMDLEHWNSKYTLLRLDKLTMAHGLEARVPFLDHELVEFVLSLPQKYKIRGKTTKWILREAMLRNNVLPRKIAYRPKKAFYLPAEKTFGKPFIAFARDILSSRKCIERGFFQAKGIDLLFNLDHSELLNIKKITSAVIMELWLQLFEDRQWLKFQS